mmetsp:Transcript_54579/g.127088  ORF Transcript_54579/g.127088 Transcript_54579/m.127088 type:complete len:360 (+) Transcript_54579:106-1185(+)
MSREEATGRPTPQVGLCTICCQRHEAAGIQVQMALYVSQDRNQTLVRSVRSERSKEPVYRFFPEAIAQGGCRLETGLCEDRPDFQRILCAFGKVRTVKGLTDNAQDLQGSLQVQTLRLRLRTRFGRAKSNRPERTRRSRLRLGLRLRTSFGRAKSNRPERARRSCLGQLYGDLQLLQLHAVSGGRRSCRRAHLGRARPERKRWRLLPEDWTLHAKARPFHKDPTRLLLLCSVQLCPDSTRRSSPSPARGLQRHADGFLQLHHASSVRVAAVFFETDTLQDIEHAGHVLSNDDFSPLGRVLVDVVVAVDASELVLRLRLAGHVVVLGLQHLHAVALLSLQGLRLLYVLLCAAEEFAARAA